MLVRPGRIDLVFPDPVSPLNSFHSLESFYVKGNLCEEFFGQFLVAAVFGLPINLQGADICIPFGLFFRGKRWR